MISFFIADTKAQFILGGCSSFTAKNSAATVCWLCGKNQATILHEFGYGMGVICTLRERTLSGRLNNCMNFT